MQLHTNSDRTPFFSICIPQYNRTSFLIENLKVLKQQTFHDFEVCISDDRSPDGRQNEVADFLENSGLTYSYQVQENNLRYDGNIRASIALARGQYCLLMGNDDCLSSAETLNELFIIMRSYKNAGVVITNFEDWQTGIVTKRIRKGGNFGSGPDVAAGHYRDVAFVSGVILDRVKAQALTTYKWDGVEMYQMYLMARIIASGSDLIGVEDVVVKKDICIQGETVDDYTLHPKIRVASIKERVLPFCHIGRLVADAILPVTNESKKAGIAEKIIKQLYFFTYPYWIFEYRRVQSWHYALEICLGMRPQNVFKGLPLGSFRELRLSCIYGVACFCGLIIPLWLFDKARPVLYALAKSVSLQSEKGTA